jgi:hypothetical protein
LNPLERLRATLAPHKAALVEHPLYRELGRIEALRTFMEHHVFAVWDFMSLLKSLQRRVTCLDVPWVPARDAQNVRLVNEIVLGEECDSDGHGGYASHFELYRRAMEECGANIRSIDRFIGTLYYPGSTVNDAFGVAPAPAREFLQQTFAVIDRGDVCEIAAVFTCGREDLLPAVFQQIVERLNVEHHGSLARFKYYLERHIGLDGDEHGPMANRLLATLCGDEPSRWERAEQAAVECLTARARLWDGIRAAIGAA